MLKCKGENRGFTILEVIVALVIVGVSLTMFIGLLGHSAKLRSKVDDYDERLNIAITKAEHGFLGLVDGPATILDNNKNVLQGRADGTDISWRIEDKSFDGFSGYDRDVFLYNVSVEGIDISSVGFR
ncbi:MAG: prepilin-type N-terminal cleavage/methylation domain-containing protein [Planctomycetota bacterium]|jgi:prepilin-type N-terminal cleavage/methylation domain-containing protein